VCLLYDASHVNTACIRAISKKIGGKSIIIDNATSVSCKLSFTKEPQWLRNTAVTYKFAATPDLV